MRIGVIGVIGVVAALLLSGCTSDGASQPPPESNGAVVSADPFGDMYEVGTRDKKSQCSMSPRVVVRTEGRVLGSPPAGLAAYEHAVARVGDLVVVKVHGLCRHAVHVMTYNPRLAEVRSAGTGVFRFRAAEPGRAAIVVGMPSCARPVGYEDPECRGGHDRVGTLGIRVTA